MLYYGTFSLAAASVLFAIYCPAPCRRYETAVDYANAEASFFTASPRIMQRLISKRLEDRPESKSLIDLKLATDNVNVTLGTSPYERRLEATYVVLDQYWHMLDPNQRWMRLTCRMLYDFGLLLVAIPAVTTFAGVLDYLVGGRLFG